MAYSPADDIHDDSKSILSAVEEPLKEPSLATAPRHNLQKNSEFTSFAGPSRAEPSRYHNRYAAYHQNEPLSCFAPQNITFMDLSVKKTSFDLADVAPQKNTFLNRSKKLQNLAEKIGLDCIAVCSDEEEDLLDRDLNAIASQSQIPWYDCLKEREFDKLFAETQNDPYCAQQPRKKQRSTSKDKSADIIKDFGAKVAPHKAQYSEAIKKQYPQKKLGTALASAFASAQSKIQTQDEEERQLVRFALDLAASFLQLSIEPEAGLTPSSH